MIYPRSPGPADKRVAEIILEILYRLQCFGESSAKTNEQLLDWIRNLDGFRAVDERQLRRAYAENLGVCTGPHSVYLPKSPEDRAKFKKYLETKVRTQAIHAAQRLKRLDEAFPQFAPNRNEPVQFELDLDRIA
jgi:hypothetical protein